MGVDGVFVSLLRQFVSSQMVSLAMGNRRGGVGVGCKVMEFGDSFVRALWHGILLGKQQSIAPPHLRQMAGAAQPAGTSKY